MKELDHSPYGVIPNSTSTLALISMLQSSGVFPNGVEKIESIIRFSNPDVDIFVNVSNVIETTLLSRAQLFERRLALTRGKILTRVSFSLHQKDSLG